MKIVVLSNSTDVQKEHDYINALFEKGMDCFHLRKPGYSRPEFESFLRAINPKFYKRISIHSNYELIQKYNLGGIHVPEQLRKDSSAVEICKAARKKGIKVSTSIHEDTDVTGMNVFDRVFLSPVFDSISKKEYKGIKEEKLLDLLNLLRTVKSSEVVALGGVEENKIEKVIELGFDGLAILGAMWEDPGQSAATFARIKSKLEKLQNV